MAGNVSLEAAIRTCKIDTAYADKVFSDRFLNPNNMVCPVWHGYDSTGRPACANSFNTKSGGCNSAQDRVFVENYQRPQYVEYVNLSSGGIEGSIYGPPSAWDANTQWDNMKRTRDLQSINNITGQFGQQFGAKVYPNCGVHQYRRAMAQNEEALRKYSSFNQSYRSDHMKKACGM